MHTFTTQRKIEFADTDMGGIVHFSRYAVFMETAEHRFREAAGHVVHAEQDGRPIGWPRVAMTVEYHSPARFGEVLDIQVRVLRIGEKSLTCGFELSCGDRRVATGTMTSVCCILDPREEVRAISIPKRILSQLEVAPEHGGV